MRRPVTLVSSLALCFLTLVGGCAPIALVTGNPGLAEKRRVRTVPLAERPPVSLPGAGGLVPLPPAADLPASPVTPVGTTNGTAPAVTPAPVLPPAGGNPAGGGLVSNNAASLTGLVLAPPGLLANNGAGLVSNNASSLVSNNGGGLTAGRPSRYYVADQRPLASARVYVLDAEGRPLAGPDGKAVYALTGPGGRYAFSGALPTHNLVLAVELAGDKGLVQAILPKEGTSPRAVDLDLVSTLSTSYILDRYVGTQAENQATLDKLPASAEADTRRTASAAFSAAGGTPPSRFSPEETVPLVDHLRRQDTRFDAQMEVVKNLLVAAGQSDLGNGRLATDVSLAAVTSLLVAPDGALLFADYGACRVWRLGQNGALQNVAGNGAEEYGYSAPNGTPALEAAVKPAQLVTDGQGRTLILNHDALLRLEADGRLTVLWRKAGAAVLAEWDGKSISAVYPRDAASLWVRVGDYVNGTYALRTFDLATRAFGPAQPVPATAGLHGVDAAGRFYHRDSETRDRVTRYTRATGTAETIFTFTGLNTNNGLAVDGLGNTYAQEGGRLIRIAPDGGRETLVASLALPGFRAAALAPDGTVYLANADHIWRVRQGAVQLVAGSDGGATTGDAGDLSLAWPDGLAVLSTGGFYVGDANADRIYRVDAAGRLAQTLIFTRPTALRLGPGGALYALNYTGLYRLDPSGFTRLLALDDELRAEDFLVARDGKVYVLALRYTARENQLLRLEPGGATTLLGRPGDGSSVFPYSLAEHPDGSVYIGALRYPDDQIFRYTAASGVQLYKTLNVAGFAAHAGLAFDATGRLYGTDALAVVSRLNPAATAAQAVAGKGTGTFGGTGVDDSLRDPCSPAFDGSGNLYVIDRGHRQVKKIPASAL